MTLFKPRVGKVIFAQTTGGLSVIIPNFYTILSDFFFFLIGGLWDHFIRFWDKWSLRPRPRATTALSKKKSCHYYETQVCIKIKMLYHK